ncbi:vitronectin b isoform X2 [Melanotaenia boesemani]|uniref:vitronectin b isoform X2 n=1 Tax=Melanotaenia boesemani TaxID=1250792 RepID=UPI001C0587D6|nr:vitronectin b isoform X2 [Melanotaenia boesemani]
MEAAVRTLTTSVPKKVTARGDNFEETQDVTEAGTTADESTMSLPSTIAPTVFFSLALPPNTTYGPTSHVDPDAEPCSGRPFDAFLQLKNGSIYAFRGEYFFELDDKSILPGYPKLIQDVWGISGPISAAFTRINCQGKSYIFKGKKYWRFDGGVLDEAYPRDISVGFDGIPNDVDAAFAVPAPSHNGKEKAYFFKGDQYYQYEFKYQPSHEECVGMSKASPSLLFARYTDLYCDQTLEDLFAELFGPSFSSHNVGPHYISRGWQGIRPPVDAAMVGRVYLTPKPTSPPPPARRKSSRRRRPSRRRGRQQRRQSRYVFDDLWLHGDWFDFGEDYSDITDESTTPEFKSTPVQNVYFFKRDKYFRVSLQTKRVDAVIPPYPRSIAKYWLGCKHEETPDAAREEKK